MRKIDLQHKTEYIPALRTFIELGCSVSEAAAALFLHRNTLANRLKKISELADLDWGDRELMFNMKPYFRSRLV